jgi:hypothetical protein
VNAAQFLYLMSKSDSLSQDELMQLKKVQENFPYFQIANVLIARSEFLEKETGNTPSLGFAAITSPDRIWLKSLIEKPLKLAKQERVKPALLEIIEGDPVIDAAFADTTKEPQTSIVNERDLEEGVKPKPKRRKLPKDDLIETIKRKEKKEVDSKKQEQNALIKAFSKASIKKATIKEIEANKNPENLALSSTVINDSLVSEAYAKILASQGKNKLAKQLFEKLILKFPDKRTYFANLIEKLKD